MTWLATYIIVGSAVLGLIGFLTLRRAVKRLSVLLLLLGVLLVFAGVWLIATQSEMLVTTRQHVNWPTTEGTVVTSEVVGTRAFHPHIVYQYTVAGVTYRDSTALDLPSVGGRHTAYDAASWIVEQYPVGRKVTIHYNPDNPTESGIRVFPSWDVYGKLSVGAVVLIGGLILTLLGAVPRRR